MPTGLDSPLLEPESEFFAGNEPGRWPTLKPPAPAGFFSLDGADINIEALVVPGGGRPKLKAGLELLVGAVVGPGVGRPKPNEGFGAIDAGDSWFFPGSMVVPGGGGPNENGCLVDPIVVLCVAPNPNPLKSLVPEEAPNPPNEEVGFAPGRAPNENTLSPSFISFVATPTLLKLGCWRSASLRSPLIFSSPLSFSSSSTSMEVLWLDPAAALDPESEVKDTVFPPKEKPLVSAGNPPVPVAEVVVDVGGTSEPRETDFPAKVNPRPMTVESTAGNKPDRVWTDLRLSFKSFRFLQYPANSSLKSVNTSSSNNLRAVARKEMLSPRRPFQYSTSSWDARISLSAEGVPFIVVCEFEAGKENIGFHLASGEGILKVSGPADMEGEVPLGLAVISFFRGLEVEG